MGATYPGRYGAHVAAIEVLDADITTLDVDAIANAANTQLQHGGGVAGGVRGGGGAGPGPAGGRATRRAPDARAPIGLGGGVETSGGDMPCRWVIHAATME